MTTTFTLEDGFKPMHAPRRYKQKGVRPVSIVPAWRVVGSDGTETKWTSVRGEALVWGRILQSGNRPMGAY